jgi:hypothetical protein
LALLTQFIFRLSFGLALGMALTNPRQVTSGYYRNHLYVLLGLAALAAMVAFSAPDRFALAPPLTAAILSYAGAVAWLYEKPRPGIALLVLVAAANLWGAWVATAWPDSTSQAVIEAIEPLSGGLVLGFTIAAMFLGHWYLNTPSMAIGPLERLIGFMAAAILLQAVVAGADLVVDAATVGRPSLTGWLFIALRWLAGIFGSFALAVMAFKTLKIPNTQSATGILYVAVIATFLGELTAMLSSGALAGSPGS